MRSNGIIKFESIYALCAQKLIYLHLSRSGERARRIFSSPQNRINYSQYEKFITSIYIINTHINGKMNLVFECVILIVTCLELGMFAQRCNVIITRSLALHCNSTNCDECVYLLYWDASERRECARIGV